MNLGQPRHLRVDQSGRPRHLRPDQFALSMPAPVIPVRRMPWFMKALWLLAALLLFGTAYSFWRISHVPAPKLDVPAQPVSLEQG